MTIKKERLFLILLILTLVFCISPVMGAAYSIVVNNGSIPEYWMNLNTQYSISDIPRNENEADAQCVELGYSYRAGWGVYGFTTGYFNKYGVKQNASAKINIIPESSFDADGIVTWNSSQYSGVFYGTTCWDATFTNSYSLQRLFYNRIDYLPYYNGITVNFYLDEYANSSNKINGATIKLGNGQEAITDVNGHAAFYIPSNSENTTFTITHSDYNTITDYLGQYGAVGGIIYISMTKKPQAQYFITVSPGWIPADGTQYLYGQLHSNPSTKINNVTGIQWTWKKFDSTGKIISDSMKRYVNTTNSNLFHFYTKKSDGHFYAYSGSTLDYTTMLGTTLPNPVSLNPVGGMGAIETSAKIFIDSGEILDYKLTNLIGDNTSALNNVNIFVKHALTGYLISVAEIDIKNDRTGVWTNTSTSNGKSNYFADIGEQLTIVGKASGFKDAIYTKIDVTKNMSYDLNLYPTNYNSGNLTTLVVRLYTDDSPALVVKNVQFTIQNTNNASEIYYKVSGSNGATWQLVYPETEYEISVDGGNNYYSQSQIINTGSNDIYDMNIYLTSKYKLTGTITYTPTPTAPSPYDTVTLIPSPTITPKGWTDEEVGVCGEEISDPSNFILWLKSKLACNGLRTGMSQSLAISALVIMLSSAFCAIYGKAMGGAIGAIIGFIMSFVLGLIPFAAVVLLVIILVALAVILIGSKFTNSGG